MAETSPREKLWEEATRIRTEIVSSLERLFGEKLQKEGLAIFFELLQSECEDELFVTPFTEIGKSIDNDCVIKNGWKCFEVYMEIEPQAHIAVQHIWND